jgi:hypothetical protein
MTVFDLSTIPDTAKLRENAITELQKYITQSGIQMQLELFFLLFRITYIVK